MGRDGGFPRHPTREGGELGDPLMPMLSVLGQHRALVAIQALLWEGECVFAFFDDICVVCSPERVIDIHAIIQQSFFAHARISVHPRQNASVEPRRCCSVGHRHHHSSGQSAGSKCSSLERSQELPATRQGLKVLRGLQLGTHSMCKSS